RRPGAGRQARAARDRARGAGDDRREAAPLPRPRATGRFVRAGDSLGHGGGPGLMTTVSNLLAFFGLVVTLLIVWRQSWPARRRLCVAQSLQRAERAGPVPGGRPRSGLLWRVAGRAALGRLLGFVGFENGRVGLAGLAPCGLRGIVGAGVALDVLGVVLIMEAGVVEVRRVHV